MNLLPSLTLRGACVAPSYGAALGPRPSIRLRRAASTTLSFVLAWMTLSAVACDHAYCENADAKADVRHALSQSATSHKPVLLIFGANWCEDCRALDQAIKSPATAELLSHEFELVKIDVGNFNHNLDIATTYGNPIKNGIPAAVLLTADSRVLYATHAGELADARRMSNQGVYQFFKSTAERTQDKPQH
ncbi:thioredoxin family protein [Aquabacterium sp.]|uniref:thioredoxin family protein n=1 Tax=Aquabacterium sp. TaxID=1872578 RepID=UPI0035B1A813